MSARRMSVGGLGLLCLLSGCGAAKQPEPADESSFVAADTHPFGANTRLVGDVLPAEQSTRIGLSSRGAVALVEGDYRAPLRWGNSKTSAPVGDLHVRIRHTSTAPTFFDSEDDPIGHGELEPSWFEVPVEVTLSGAVQPPERFLAFASVDHRYGFRVNAYAAIPEAHGFVQTIGEHTTGDQADLYLSLAVAGDMLSGVITPGYPTSEPVALIGEGGCIGNGTLRELNWGLPAPLSAPWSTEPLVDALERPIVDGGTLSWSDGGDTTLNVRAQPLESYGCLRSEVSLGAPGQASRPTWLEVPVLLDMSTDDGRFALQLEGSASFQWEATEEDPVVDGVWVSGSISQDYPTTATRLGFPRDTLPPTFINATTIVRFGRSEFGQSGSIALQCWGPDAPGQLLQGEYTP